MIKWIELKPGCELPLVNQRIYYVVDYRGSPQETRNKLWNDALASMNAADIGIPISYNRYPDGTRTVREYIEIFKPVDPTLVKIKDGYVHDRYPDCFTVRPHAKYHYWYQVFSDVDLITHWAAFPELELPEITRTLEDKDKYDYYDQRMKWLIEGQAYTDAWSSQEASDFNKAHSLPEPA